MYVRALPISFCLIVPRWLVPTIYLFDLEFLKPRYELWCSSWWRPGQGGSPLKNDNVHHLEEIFVLDTWEHSILHQPYNTRFQLNSSFLRWLSDLRNLALLRTYIPLVYISLSFFPLVLGSHNPIVHTSKSWPPCHPFRLGSRRGSRLKTSGRRDTQRTTARECNAILEVVSDGSLRASKLPPFLPFRFHFL